jgi:hypothetical protein
MNMATYSEKAAVALGAVGPASSLLGWDWTETSGRTAAWLEYVGRTALVLTGPFTGQRYYFARPGARLAVDIRDWQALQAVPVLRPVRG